MMRSIKHEGSEVDGVFTLGTTSDFTLTSTIDCKEGRFFNEIESREGAQVVVIGYDVADALFPSESPIGKTVLINGQNFKVIGVNTRQGTFLGLFSWDSMVALPLASFNKYFSSKSVSDVRPGGSSTESDVRVKVKDKKKLAEAKDELTGIMRRVRGLPPEKKDDFSINEQQAFKSTLDPVKNTIAIAGSIHHRPLAFRRRDRNHEHHVCERERADQGNRNTQGARRAPADDSAAIPDRIDRALSVWAD